MNEDSQRLFNDAENHFSDGPAVGEEEAASVAEAHGFWLRKGAGHLLHIPTEKDGRVEPVCSQVSPEEVRKHGYDSVPDWMVEDNVCGACIIWMDEKRVRGEIAAVEFTQRV